MTDERPTTWTLVFEPLGVLLFRDDRPFDAGQHSLAVSRFPLPSVFRGAVRTALFEVAGADFREPNFGLAGIDQELLGGATTNNASGKTVAPEAFDIRGPLVARQVAESRYEYVLPWPRDLVVTATAEHDDGKQRLSTEVMHTRVPPAHGAACLRMGPLQGGARTFSPTTTALPWTVAPRLPKPKGKPWLTAAGAQTYVERSRGSGPLPPLVEGRDWLEQHDFLVEETRVGIARATQSGGERLVAADSMFYTLIAWRMASRFRFAVEVSFSHLREPRQSARIVELLRQLDGRLVRLGGKSGHARVEVLEHGLAPAWAQPDPAKTPPSSKLWLWTPGLYDPSTTPGVTATLGDTLRLGGFDMANHRPRPLQGALDRGSVLWFSALDHQALADHQQTLAKAHDLPLPSYGYGQWIPRSNS